MRSLSLKPWRVRYRKRRNRDRDYEKNPRVIIFLWPDFYYYLFLEPSSQENYKIKIKIT
jgi:hypothetical protein